MPRLSLYRPEKGADYKFIDRQASEMFQAGGTDVYLHKYMGPKASPEWNIAATYAVGALVSTTAGVYKAIAASTGIDPTNTAYWEFVRQGTNDQQVFTSQNVTNIQDLLFLENRDRKYDPEIYRIRGMYNVQNIDFNLSQFGLFIDNDTLYMTVHINDFVKYIGRKPISGDVIELPHLRDDFALGDFDVSMPRYYVIEDVGRASEGFSVTWYPHLYRLKLKKITDNQQFSDIFNQPAKDVNGDPDPSGKTLRDLLSTYNKELAINDQVVAQAEADAPKSGYETQQFFTLATTSSGQTILKTADLMDLDASMINEMASTTNATPIRSGYTGYLLGDGVPPNGEQFGHGIQFPDNPYNGDYFLRTDFLPNRLFRFNGTKWTKVEDAVRMTMTNNDTRQTQKTSFINNTNTNRFFNADGTHEDVPERQSLSQAIKPRADL